MKKLFMTLQACVTILLMMLIACSKPASQDSIVPENNEETPVIPSSLTARAITILNPGFESDKANWGDASLFAISTSDKHSGSKSAKLSASGDRIQQAVTVTQNTDYTLTAWILGKGTIGAKSGSTVLNSQGGTYSAWTQVSVTFNSGSATSVTLYGAYNAGEGRFDDFALDEGSTSGTVPATPAGLGAAAVNATSFNLT